MSASSRLPTRLAAVLIRRSPGRRWSPRSRRPRRRRRGAARVGSSSSGSSKARQEHHAETPGRGRPQATSWWPRSSATTTTRVSAPTGWTLVREDSIEDRLHQAVYVKVGRPVGAEAPTPGSSPKSRRVAGGITAYAGVDTTHPVDAHAASASPARAPRWPRRRSPPGPRTPARPPRRHQRRGVLGPPARHDDRLEAGPPPQSKKTTDVLASSADASWTTGGGHRAPHRDGQQARRRASGPSSRSARPPRPLRPPLRRPPPHRPPPHRPPLRRPPPHRRLRRPPPPSGPIRSWSGPATSPPAPTPPAPRRRSALLDRIPGTVFTLGDNAYVDGTASEYRNCYEPTWGRHKARTGHRRGRQPRLQHPRRRRLLRLLRRRRRRIRPRATTDTTSATGTSSSSTATASRSVGAGPARPRSSGCGRSWPPARPSAPWRCGTTRTSARPRSTARTPPTSPSGRRSTTTAPTSSSSPATTSTNGSGSRTPPARPTRSSASGSSPSEPAAGATSRPLRRCPTARSATAGPTGCCS